MLSSKLGRGNDPGPKKPTRPVTAIAAQHQNAVYTVSMKKAYAQTSLKSLVLAGSLAGLFSSGLWLSPSTVRAQEQERVTSLLFTCNVSFSASGRSIYLGVGISSLEGRGLISCYDYLTGTQQKIPIRVSARGPGLGIGVTGINLSGAATGIGLTKAPESLLGRYAAVRANGAIGIGAGAAMGLRFSRESVTIDVSLQAQSGLGAGIEILDIELKEDGPKTIEKVASAPPLPTQGTLVASMAPVVMPSQPLPPPTPAPEVAPTPSPVAVATPAPVRVLYVSENQPVHLVDSSGRLLQVLYLRSPKKK